MKSDSNDVKVLVGQVVSYIADGRSERFRGDAQLVPALVMGTKEKNSIVRSCSEAALVSVLKLRSGEATYQVSFHLSLVYLLKKGCHSSAEIPRI